MPNAADPEHRIRAPKQTQSSQEFGGQNEIDTESTKQADQQNPEEIAVPLDTFAGIPDKPLPIKKVMDIAERDVGIVVIEFVK